MPDMERLLDQLALDLAEGDPGKQSYVRGFIDGKRHTRKEILYTLLFVLVMAGLIALPVLFSP